MTPKRHWELAIWGVQAAIFQTLNRHVKSREKLFSKMRLWRSFYGRIRSLSPDMGSYRLACLDDEVEVVGVWGCVHDDLTPDLKGLPTWPTPLNIHNTKEQTRAPSILRSGQLRVDLGL